MAHRQIDLNASLQRVLKGGIPIRAEERLAEEAGPHSKLFTSDLSVAEFVLARDAGCQPIAQLMGSSIYHVGQIPDYKGKTAEMQVISDAHRESRRLALGRLWQEATLVGADAVVGAQLRDRMITMGARGKGGDDGGEVSSSRSSVPPCARRSSRTRRAAHHHRPVGAGPVGAGAGRMGAVRLLLRLLQVPRLARDLGLGRRGRGDEREQRRRDGAARSWSTA